MKFSIPSTPSVENTPTIDALYSMDLRATEDLTSFFKKMVQKVEIMCGRHITFVAFIHENMKRFENLKKHVVVNTIMPRDLSCVANALQEINEDLAELRMGKKIDMKEICSDTFVKAGISYKSGHLSMVNFRNGNWGAGLNKNVKGPLMFNKTVEEFGWHSGAKGYAERFCHLVEETNKVKMTDSIKRHFGDLKKAMRAGVTKDHAVEDEKISIEQLKELSACRDALISFYFKNLRNILKASDEDPKGEEPDTEVGTGDVGGNDRDRSDDEESGKKGGLWVPNTWTGE